jgi:disulfide bond formation protein DsbB
MAALDKILTTRWYWLGLVVLGMVMEGTALYYQYQLGEEPCQICIHIRIWVAAFTLVGLLMCLLPQKLFLAIPAHVLVIASAAGLLERSWYLYQVENGRGEGSCEFFLGFPEWFALDKWFPWMFEVRNLCGYTPELPLGISMAEGNVAAACALLVVGVLALARTVQMGRAQA